MSNKTNSAAFTGCEPFKQNVSSGNIILNGSHPVKAAELALLDTQGEQVSIEGEEDAIILFVDGEPIDEPVAREGPFVMNTQEELVQAVNDYRTGKMGHLH